MATFPGPYDGASPIDASTPTGKYRVLLGDVEGEAYDPPQSGRANYQRVSDAQIEAYLSQSGDSVTKGIAFYYLTLAGQAANEAVSIQDLDLRIDKTKRAAELRAMAEFWLGQDADDEVIAGEEAFEIVETGRSSGGFIPEGSPAIWGRAYVWRQGERWPGR